MSKRTKKVGSVGRYQARYGVRARTVIRNIELIQKGKQECPPPEVELKPRIQFYAFLHQSGICQDCSANPMH